MNKEKRITRREFVRSASVGGAAGLAVPAVFGSMVESLFAAPANKKAEGDDPILVVVQLAGGNDGLNTVIPYTSDHYYRARPTLAVEKKRILRLNDAVGLHPSMMGLKELYDRGHVAIVQGVGYPKPNRSHFRSVEIWQTASDSDKYESQGWLGRYFDGYCRSCAATVAVAVGREAPRAFSAKYPKGITIERRSTRRRAKGMDLSDEGIGGPGEDEAVGGSIETLAKGYQKDLPIAPLEYLEEVYRDTKSGTEQIARVLDATPARGKFPGTRLGGELGIVSRLIAGGMPTRVYHVSQGGFDTHANQKGAHSRLLTEFSGAVKTFFEDLHACGKDFRRVTLFAFSEFGRRVSENGSGGTDHGVAAPVFLAGGSLKGGLYGAYPSLTPEALDRGDLVHTVDFRSVYATIIEKLFRVPSAPILRRRYPLLSFFA